MQSDAPTSPSSAHPWQFFRAGGVDQVLIRTGADIAHLAELDQKLWVALACPTRGVEFDPRTLDLIDTDGDGRIRPPELLAACAWACERLRDPDELARPGPAMALSALDDATEDGAALAAQARRILALAGREDAESITLDEVLERSEKLNAQRFNGDGAVSPATAEDDAEALEALKRIMATHGSVPAVADQPAGVDRKTAEAFFAEVDALQQWADGVQAHPEGMPLGDRTLQAAQAVQAVRHKVDDFFTRARLAAYDPRVRTAMHPSDDDYAALARMELSPGSDAVAALPLAPFTPDGTLPLERGINPAWAGAVQALRDKALVPLLGEPARASLSEADWKRTLDALQPCLKQLSARPATHLDALDADTVRQLHGSGVRERVMALIEQDEAEKAHNGHTLALEKLLRFKRDLLRLLNNFVSFSAFYQREWAIFQAGTLYLDARSCDLTVQVADAGRHAKLAGLAKTYLAYCDCTRKGRKMGIVAAFTAGDVDFLFVGRNGVFYDRDGLDWDATITKIIENPTSIAQAFFSPYKKFLRMIEEQVAKRAATSDSRVEKSLGATAGSLATAPGKTLANAAAPAVPAGPLDNMQRRMDVGTVAAIGVALGSLSAVAVGIFAKFVDLGAWIPIALLGIVVAISGPSMLIAWLKLRQRSLGPILDASGWAINGRMRINTRLGGSLSQTAHVPPGARRMLNDPFPESRTPAWTAACVAVVLAVAGVLAWRMGWFHRPAAPADAVATSQAVPAASTASGPAVAASAP
ncbi:hypothetical protein [Paracidovorax cattleyae]|uniref:EF-hand domain-containing protein n=1 Tax=Paracidovorax cattleyae TaxID=80868 RepID=A0A1H0Q1G7_9BURK|nr:hypothetical protein [Paracidovorax cattleyae]AVS74340.1 hypothetical protein C8240_10190 [Paracidovorax cattleyae]SDP11184.1 hypothetical protein SAMN04489708_107148 [Paracidovorax cattleyae]